MTNATYHTASKTTGHGSKAHEQHNPGLPGNAVAAVGEVVGGQPGLVYAVYDEHAQSAEDGWDPVDKGHVDITSVEGALGEDGGVNESEERDGELR